MILHKQLSLDDIKIYGISQPHDKRNAGYNIGNLLNMPYLHGISGWEILPINNDESTLSRLYIIGNTYYKSILNYYIANRKIGDHVPHIPNILLALDKYIEQNENILNDIKEIISNNNYLCIHVRCGDLLVEDDFIKLIYMMSLKYEKVIILAGIHLDEHFANNDTKKNVFFNFINFILKQNNNIFVNLDTPDMHLAIMRMSANLLLHKGTYSTLGYIISTGNLYITKYFEADKQDIFKKNVGLKHKFIEI